jgi:hypothetical protein
MQGGSSSLPLTPQQDTSLPLQNGPHLSPPLLTSSLPAAILTPTPPTPPSRHPSPTLPSRPSTPTLLSRHPSPTPPSRPSTPTLPSRPSTPTPPSRHPSSTPPSRPSIPTPPITQSSQPPTPGSQGPQTPRRSKTLAVVEVKVYSPKRRREQEAEQGTIGVSLSCFSYLDAKETRGLGINSTKIKVMSGSFEIRRTLLICSPQENQAGIDVCCNRHTSNRRK